MAQSTYYYYPLPQQQSDAPPFTRLLLLSSGREPEPLRGVLQVINIEIPPPFEALSYTWGSDFVGTPLYLEGGCLPIRQNLNAALRSLRQSNQARRLWIDALCINQEDIQERTRQVQYMRLIYKRATCVIVWLGLKTPGIEEAVALAIQLSECRHRKLATNTANANSESDPSNTSVLGTAIDRIYTEENQRVDKSSEGERDTQLISISHKESHNAMALYVLGQNQRAADLL